MAITGTDRGTGGNNTGATTITISPGSNLAAGSMAVLVLAYDNSGTNGADPFSSITDSLGNFWHRKVTALYDPAGASAGATLAIFTSYMLAGAVTTGTTITVTFSSSTTAKAWTMHELVPSANKFIRFLTGAAGTGSATGTPTVTSSSITSGDVIIGCGAVESADTWTGDSDSSSGTWSTKQSTGFGTGTSGQAVISQLKVTSGTATQTYNPTLTSADCILAWASFTEATLVGAFIGINCRSTSGYVTDSAGYVYNLGHLDTNHPDLVRGSDAFGYTTIYGDSARNRDSALDVRIAGLHQRPNSDAAQNVLRIDLFATGKFKCRAAFGDGDSGNTQNQYFQVYDNTTLLFSSSAISTHGTMADANGTTHTYANWPANNTLQTGLTFSSGICIVKYGGATVGTDNSTLAHFYIEKEADAAASVGSASGTGAATGVGASLAASAASSAGIGAATGVGSSKAASVAASAGVGAASGVGKGVAASVGSSSGTGAATGVSTSAAASVGASAGTGAASGVGKSIAASVGSAAGAGTATGIAYASATERTRYVNTGSTAGGNGTTNATVGANRAYASLAEATAAEVDDLVADNVYLKIYCEGATEDTAGTAGIGGYTTDAAHYIHILASTAGRHAGVWDSAKYHIRHEAMTILVDQSDVIIEGLQVSVGGGAPQDNVFAIFSSASAGNVTIRENLVKLDQTTSITGGGISAGVWRETEAPGNMFVVNNIVYDFTIETGIGILTFNVTGAGKTYAYHNTAYNTIIGIGDASDTGEMIARNNISQASLGSLAYFAGSAFDSLSDYNISDLTDAPGAHSIQSTTIAFANVGAKNFHTIDAAAKVANNLYADSSYAVTVDIDGGARPNSGDVYAGGDESNIGVASSTGTGAATAVGKALFSAVGSSAGIGSASGTGRATASSTASAAGSGAATGTGRATAAASASSSGTGAAAATGRALSSGVGSSTGVGAATATGKALASGIGSSAGSSTCSGTARALVASIAAAAGACIVLGVGDTGTAVTAAPVRANSKQRDLIFSAKRRRHSAAAKERTTELRSRN